MSHERRCSPCNGDGWITDRYDICPVCNGVKYIVLDGDPSDWTSCGPCNGDGWVKDRHDICQACGGVGKLLKP